jgi:hypothetical protein
MALIISVLWERAMPSKQFLIAAMARSYIQGNLTLRIFLAVLKTMGMKLFVELQRVTARLRTAPRA